MAESLTLDSSVSVSNFGNRDRTRPLVESGIKDRPFLTYFLLTAGGQTVILLEVRSALKAPLGVSSKGSSKHFVTTLCWDEDALRRPLA